MPRHRTLASEVARELVAHVLSSSWVVVGPQAVVRVSQPGRGGGSLLLVDLRSSLQSDDLINVQKVM